MNRKWMVWLAVPVLLTLSTACRHKKPVTPATDLYAFGIVIFEMVTGSCPLTGDSLLATAAKRLAEPPPSPRRHVPSLSRKWEATILRCLERDPERRFPGAREVAAALTAGWRLTAFRRSRSA